MQKNRKVNIYIYIYLLIFTHTNTILYTVYIMNLFVKSILSYKHCEPEGNIKKVCCSYQSQNVIMLFSSNVLCDIHSYVSFYPQSFRALWQHFLIEYSTQLIDLPKPDFLWHNGTWMENCLCTRLCLLSLILTVFHTVSINSFFYIITIF